MLYASLVEIGLVALENIFNPCKVCLLFSFLGKDLTLHLNENFMPSLVEIETIENRHDLNEDVLDLKN